MKRVLIDGREVIDLLSDSSEESDKNVRKRARTTPEVIDLTGAGPSHTATAASVPIVVDLTSVPTTPRQDNVDISNMAISFVPSAVVPSTSTNTSTQRQQRRGTGSRNQRQTSSTSQQKPKKSSPAKQQSAADRALAAVKAMEQQPPPANKESPKKPAVFECPICFDTINEMTSTSCGHIFCHSCIVECIKAQKKCPVCRKTARSNQLRRLFA